MSKEQDQVTIKALLEERRGYEIYGNQGGLDAVDAELERLGHNAKPPAKRATRMTARKGTEL